MVQGKGKEEEEGYQISEREDLQIISHLTVVVVLRKLYLLKMQTLPIITSTNMPDDQFGFFCRRNAFSTLENERQYRKEMLNPSPQLFRLFHSVSKILLTCIIRSFISATFICYQSYLSSTLKIRAWNPESTKIYRNFEVNRSKI